MGRRSPRRPLADLANIRLEILWAFGPATIHTFTHLYASLTPTDLTNLPYFDLCVALRPASQIAEWTTDATSAKSMCDGLKLFINTALKDFPIK